MNMGNRAVITTEENFRRNGVGVYLHWNGGITSVEGFLKYCKLKGYRCPEDDCYGWAMLVNTITNFFEDGMSCGIDIISNLDCENGDNGVYIIKDWEIVDRKFCDKEYPSNYTVDEMVKAIDEKMPEGMQLGEYLNAEEVPVEDIKLGDIVYMNRWDGIKKGIVIGFGTTDWLNGTNVMNMPYTDIFPMNGHPENNINNYLRDKTVRRVG